MENKDDLRKRILEEMTVNYSNALEKNMDLAKQFVRVTKEGKVDLLFRDRLTGEEQILLYLVGRLYAKEAGLAAEDSVGNKEFLEELGIPEGSLLPWLKSLRDGRMIKATKKGRYTQHSIAINQVAKTLGKIDHKLAERK